MDIFKGKTDKELKEDIEWAEEFCEDNAETNKKLGGCPLESYIDTMKKELEKRSKKKKKN